MSQGITGFPTFQFFLYGKLLKSFSGANKPQLETTLEELNNKIKEMKAKVNNKFRKRNIWNIQLLTTFKTGSESNHHYYNIGSR